MFRVISLVLCGYGMAAFLLSARFAVATGAPFLLAPGVLLFVAALLVFLIAPLLGRFAAAWLPTTGAPPNER